jgi:ADP-heptose:LPS heptosyltransferase
MVDTKTRRVLIYRLGSLGDMVVALPALHLVARAFPNAERRLLTNLPVHAKAPAAKAVLDGSGLVDDYFGYPVGTRSPWELLKLIWTVRQWKPEVVVYLAAARGVEAAQRDAKFLRYCGAKRLIGLPDTEALQRNFYGADTDAGCSMNWEPEAERLARCIAELGNAMTGDAASWDLQLSDADRREGARQIGAAALEMRPIAISVGTKVQAKDWGVDKWRELLARMVEAMPGRALLLIGAPEESAASEFAATGWRAGGGVVVNLCGRLNPRQSAAALERAELFVGHDSGPMHLAASVGTPCVAVFAARNIPRQWYPLGGTMVARTHRVIYHEVSCGGCGLETCVVEQKRCLTSVTVDEVMEAVMQGIGNRK